ncbi:MAG: hypothetical protein JNM18_11495 [Planctomycetaceae bacterium]|nr:hypothetical protein [Planctomycetaceae bacterium]
MTPSIDRVETFVVNYPTVGQFKFFTAAPHQPPGRITAFVKLTTNTGIVGWGQCVPSPRWSYETIESVTTLIERYLAPVLIGEPDWIGLLTDDGDFWRRVIAGGFSIGHPIAKAGVNLALWDLYGQLTQQSLAQLWQRPTCETVEMSWTLDVTNVPALAFDSLAEQVAAARARDYRSFNFKLGRGLELDSALCRELRSLAPQAHVWVDANGGLDLDTALAIAPVLADLGIAAIEQPLPGNRISWYRRLKQQGALPILLDETITTAVELAEFHELGMLDGAVLKVARSGGLSESLKIAELAEQRGLLLYGSGLTDPDVSLAASLHLFAACDLPQPVALNGPQYLTKSVLREPIQVHGPFATVPTGVGLGVLPDLP